MATKSAEHPDDEMENFEAELVAELGEGLILGADDGNLDVGEEDEFEEFEIDGHASYYEGDEFFTGNNPTPNSLPQHLDTFSKPPQTFNPSPLSQSPSSTGLVPVAARLPSTGRAPPSTGALQARPRDPPTIISATRPAHAITPSSPLSYLQPQPLPTPSITTLPSRSGTRAKHANTTSLPTKDTTATLNTEESQSAVKKNTTKIQGSGNLVKTDVPGSSGGCSRHKRRWSRDICRG